MVLRVKRSLALRIQKKEKLRKITFSFRHGEANYILDHVGSVRDVSTLLQHLKPESSFQYTQLSKNRYEDVARCYLTTFNQINH